METAQKHIARMTDDELIEMLRHDYRRRLNRYKHVDKAMRPKYGMSYDDFTKRGVVKQQNFSWEVESDSQDWEMALDGIRTVERRFRELNG